MNKKFFAALASATMAFTASGSIAVFADDFVEEKTPVVDGNVTPTPTKIKFSKENFGALVDGKVTFTGDSGTVTLTKNEEYEASKYDEIKEITFATDFKGEIKGLEYFTKLEKFDDSAIATGKIKNEALDFSANTKLETLSLTKANELAEIKLPKAFVDEDKKEEFKLTTLTLKDTELTALDLANYSKLNALTVTNSKLKALDLSVMTSGDITVTKNNNLTEVILNNGKAGKRTTLASLDLSGNTLETVNLDYIDITGELKLGDNHIGALDLSKTKVTGTVTLGNQTFYVSEKFGTVNLAETFENLDVEKVTATKYNKETGVLTLDQDETEYTYKVNLDSKTADLTVKLTKANPMHRLYNPNSGEHFYTADLEEKTALVELGWNDEGYGWVAPKKATNDKEVYRLYNPNAGDHHYTMNKGEKDTLVTYGWKYETVGWYSAEDATHNGKTVSVYRQYNPFANGAGSHNYTTDKAENDYLVSLGWTPEGTAWKALR